MANLKVILTADVENLGRVGEVVSVKPGYGRNYLVPQGKALPATKANMQVVESRRHVYEAVASRAREAAAAVAAGLAQISLSFKRKVGESQALYGSVTAADIAAELAERGVDLDKRRILLADNIKALGEYRVPIRLHPDVTAEVRVEVVAENVPPPVEHEPEGQDEA